MTASVGTQPQGAEAADAAADGAPASAAAASAGASRQSTGPTIPPSGACADQPPPPKILRGKGTPAASRPVEAAAPADVEVAGVALQLEAAAAQQRAAD
mmetsp:Transcript_115461/g.367187  ORF Transcript_115461/g.367187 Transcript_115461/m.367187 type:complete len:99 (+) Transcript_115461:209-505(+)